MQTHAWLEEQARPMTPGFAGGDRALDHNQIYLQQAGLARQNLLAVVGDYRMEMLHKFMEGTQKPAPGQIETLVQPAAATAFPPEVVAEINRWEAPAKTRFTNREAGEQFAPRTVPRQTKSDGETVAVAAMKDIVSGFMTRGEKDPYHAVKHWGPEGHRVGRYGLTAAQYRSWLVGLSESQLKELTAESKLPRGAIELANFLKAHPDGADSSGSLSADAKQFNDFLNKLQRGDDNDKPSATEIDRYLNKYLQEKMGSDLIRTYAQQTADRDPVKGGLLANIPKIALSMYLGRAARGEADDPLNRSFMDAVLKQWPLAVRKEQGESVINTNNRGRNIAAVAEANVGRALWQGSGTGANLGCVSSVSNILRQAGLGNIREINVGIMAQHLQDAGWRRDSFANRRPGDIIVAGNSRAGHVGIVAADINWSYDNHSGSGQWSRDPFSMWYGMYRGLPHYVLHPPGTA